MDWVKIGGRVYDVHITELKESFNILYSDNTGRTLGIGAPLVLDPYGTFFGHTVTFEAKQGKRTEFDELYNTLSYPRIEGIRVEIVHGQSTISYSAYVSSGGRDLLRIDDKNGKVYWKSFQANFIAIEAQVVPR